MSCDISLKREAESEDLFKRPRMEENLDQKRSLSSDIWRAGILPCLSVSEIKRLMLDPDNPFQEIINNSTYFGRIANGDMRTLHTSVRKFLASDPNNCPGKLYNTDVDNLSCDQVYLLWKIENQMLKNHFRGFQCPSETPETPGIVRAGLTSEQINSLLHEAAVNNIAPIVSAIMQGEREPEISVESFGDCLFDAVHEGHLEIIRLMINHTRLQNGQEQPIVNQQLFKDCLLDAVHEGHLDIVQFMITHTLFNNVGQQFVEDLFYEAVHCGRLDIIRYIMNQNCFANVSGLRLGFSLRKAVEKNYLDIAQELMRCERFQEIPVRRVGDSVYEAIVRGQTDTLRSLMGKPIFTDVPVEYLENGFLEAVEVGHLDVITMLLQHAKSSDFAPDTLTKAIQLAIDNNHMDCANCIITHLSPQGLEELIKQIVEKDPRFGQIIMTHPRFADATEQTMARLFIRAASIERLDIIQALNISEAWVIEHAFVASIKNKKENCIQALIMCGYLEKLTKEQQKNLYEAASEYDNHTMIPALVQNGYFEQSIEENPPNEGSCCVM